jgi:segregation and condensation protein B
MDIPVENIKPIIESLLFISGEPLAISKISEVLNLDEKSVITYLVEMSSDYENNNRGLRLIIDNNKVSLVTSPLASSYVAKLSKMDLEGDLSPASLETLAIVAYRGPLSRMEIDDIRGVNSSYILRALLLRGLLDRNVHPQRANSYIYALSHDFFKFLGINKVEDLPDYLSFSQKEIKADI